MSHPFFNRRQFLFSSLGTAGVQAVLRNPVAHLVASILAGAAAPARAEGSTRPRKYVFMPLMGGPPRWTFMPFCPHPEDVSKMVYNPMVATRFMGSAPYAKMEFKTIQKDGIAWPWLWQFNVAKAGGGMRPMSELSANLLDIRGILAASAHGPAQQQRYHPGNIPFSFGSLVTDVSPAAIPAVNYQAENYRHRSKAEKATVNLNGSGNLLTQLLDGLTAAPRKFHRISKGPQKELLKAAQQDLEALARDESSGYNASAESFKAARDAMERGFGNLGTTWTALLGKYQDLIKRTMAQTLPGINDAPVGAAVSGRALPYAYFEDNVIQNADLRTMFTATSAPGRMASSFALAEFILLNDLSDNIALGIMPMQGVNIVTNARTYSTFYSFDEHTYGSYISLLMNTFFNMALSSCLLELFDRLKEKSLFNEVMIDVSGEMGRNPHTTQKGSDHGGEALDVSMWSGAFDAKPQIVGDVRKSPPANYRYVSEGVGDYPGSWGFGAPNNGVGILTLGNLAATQAQILRVPNPARSSASLVKETATGIVSTLPLGRTV